MLVILRYTCLCVHGKWLLLLRNMVPDGEQKYNKVGSAPEAGLDLMRGGGRGVGGGGSEPGTSPPHKRSSINKGSTKSCSG